VVRCSVWPSFSPRQDPDYWATKDADHRSSCHSSALHLLRRLVLQAGIGQATAALNALGGQLQLTDHIGIISPLSPVIIFFCQPAAIRWQ